MIAGSGGRGWSNTPRIQKALIPFTDVVAALAQSVSN
jgi:hypothetical protein